MSFYSREILKDSPAVWYRFTESSGTSAADSSGFNRTGTYSGPISYRQGSLLGLGDTASQSFLVTTTVSDVAVPVSGLASAAFSCEIWAKFTGGSPYNAYATTYGTSATNNSFVLRYDGSTTGKWLTGLGAANVTSSVSVIQNTIYHVVVTFDGANLIIYVNGSNTGSTTASALASISSGMWIASFLHASNSWTGDLAEWAWYNSALSSARVLAHYRAAADSGDLSSGGGITAAHGQAASTAGLQASHLLGGAVHGQAGSTTTLGISRFLGAAVHGQGTVSTPTLWTFPARPVGRGGFRDFAAGTLQSGVTAAATAIPLQTRQGLNFPSPPFFASLESEGLLVTGVAGDTLTVVRGLEGSASTSHSPGTILASTPAARDLDHLWWNLPDRYDANVPPAARNATASSYDDEFEGTGLGWTNVPGSGVITCNSPRSYLTIVGSTAASHVSKPLPSPGSSALLVSAPLTAAGPLAAGSAWQAWLAVGDGTTFGVSTTLRGIGIGTDGVTRALGVQQPLVTAGQLTLAVPRRLGLLLGVQPSNSISGAATVLATLPYSAAYHQVALLWYQGTLWVLVGGAANTWSVVTAIPLATAPASAGLLLVAPTAAATLAADWFRVQTAAVPPISVRFS